MTIIGLTGYAQSGKDTVGGILVKYGFERIAFADALRDCLYVLNPIIGHTTQSTNCRLATHVDAVGWDEAKQEPEVRRLLQLLGTEVGRQRIYDDVWVDAATRYLLPNTAYVFTDVRFPNEAQRIKDLGGEVWRVDRTGTRPVNAHASETALDEWEYDYVVFNTGTLEDLDDIVTIGLACAEDK